MPSTFLIARLCTAYAPKDGCIYITGYCWFIANVCVWVCEFLYQRRATDYGYLCLHKKVKK